MREPRSTAWRSLYHLPFWSPVWSGVAAIGWAGWVLLYAPPLAAMRPYSLFGADAPDQVWAALMGLAGVAQILAAFSHVRGIRGAVDGLLTIAWGMMAWRMGLAMPHTPTVPVFAVLGAMNAQSAVWLLGPWLLAGGRR